MALPTILTAGATIPPPVAALGTPIPITVEPSKMISWCWASVGLAVARFYHDTSVLQQCDVANRVLQRADCCPTATQCNSVELLSSALGTHLFRIVFDPGLQTLQFVQQQIDTYNRAVPVGLAIGNSGHFIVIVQYWIDQSGDEWLGILDPDFDPTGPIHVSVAGLRQNYRGWQWHCSYITV